MKTKDRILETSLLLFNEEGEENVSTVDIANELEISPGNLYYHFKGKESIIACLYQQFEKEFLVLLDLKALRRVRLRDQWFYMYVILEHIHAYRFFYLNLSNLLIRYPSIEKRFRRLVEKQIQTVVRLCYRLVRRRILTIGSSELQRLAETVIMTITYWFQYQNLITPGARYQTLIHKGVFQVLSLFGPYMSGNQRAFYEGCADLYDIVLTP